METTPLDALQFLDSVLSKVGGSRQDHVNIQGAIGIIGKALAEHQASLAQSAPSELVESSFPSAEEVGAALPSPPAPSQPAPASPEPAPVQ